MEHKYISPVEVEALKRKKMRELAIRDKEANKRFRDDFHGSSSNLDDDYETKEINSYMKL